MMLKPGKIKRIEGEGSMVIAAPHGDRDKFTAEIVTTLCKRLGCAGVVAGDFVNPETSKRVNVNRPTEGAGIEPQEEVPTSLASSVYHRFLSAILKASGKKLRRYVEIHGNEHEELAKRIEVATYNVPQRLSRRLVKEYKRSLDDAAFDASDGVRENPIDLVQVELKVEGIDRIEKRAWANKLFGVLPLAEASLHFELPMTIRKDEQTREFYIDILEDVIRFWGDWIEFEEPK